MEDKKTIIVTGGAGFIGSNFVYYMLKKYPFYRIVCLDALTYAGNLSTLKKAIEAHPDNFRFVKADIRDKEAVEKYLKNGAQPSSRVAFILKKNGVKLPKWVKEPSKKQATAKHADKLRKNQPKEEAPAEAVEAPVEATETPAE